MNNRFLNVALATALAALCSQGQEYWTNTTAGSYNLSTASNWEDANALDNTATDLRFFIDSASTDLTLLGAYVITNDLTGLALNRLDLDGQSAATGRSVLIDGNTFSLNAGATLNLGNQASSGGNAFSYTVSAPVSIGGNLAIAGSPGSPGGITFSNVTLPGTAAAFSVTSNNRVSLNNVSLDANHSFTGSGTGGITFGGTVTLTGNRILDTSGNTNTQLGGTITDGANSYSLTKTGAGILTIASANHSFDGGIVVQQGTLALLAGGGTFNHSPGGVTVQNGSTIRLDWSGTPSGSVTSTPINYSAGGGIFEFGSSSGNPTTVTMSGDFTGSGDLQVVSRNGKDSIVLSGDNSAYAGEVAIKSSSPTSTIQSQVVYFNDANARFGSDSSAVIQVIDGGRVGFTSSVVSADLAPFSFGRRGGIVLSGSSGALDSTISNPYAAIGAGGGITLFNRDNLNNDRIDNSAAVNLANKSLYIVGRNASGNLTNETVGALSYSGSGYIALDLLNSTNSGVKLTTASLSAPSAGNTLQLTAVSTSDEWGTANNQSHIIVTGAKPAVTNGMVSPGIQYFQGGNSLGYFMTFSGNDLIKASSTSTDINTAGSTDIVNIGASSATLTADNNVYALRLGQNLVLNSGTTLTLGSGGLIMSSNTISGAGTLNFGSGGGFIGAYNAASQATISAKISGSGGLTILGSSQTLNISSASNDFTGGVFINGGTVRLAGTAANGNTVTVNAFGRLVAGASAGGTDTIGGLSGTGVVSSWMANAGTTAGTLVIATPAGTYTFDGYIMNGNTSARPLNITKDGVGTQVFGTDSVGTHTGTLSINNGILLVNGDFSAATGNVTVDSGATLGGSGTLGGATTVSGAIAPGNSIGTLKVNADVTWNASANAADAWKFELGALNTSDLLNITGSFLKGTITIGEAFVFDFGGSTATGTFKLVDWTVGSDFLASDFSYINLGGGNSGVFSVNGSQLDFSVAVPEPAAMAALIGLAALGVALWRRRRG